MRSLDIEQKVALWIGLGFVAAIALGVWAASTDAARRESAPCSEFAAYGIRDVPVRCYHELRLEAPR